VGLINQAPTQDTSNTFTNESSPAKNGARPHFYVPIFTSPYTRYIKHLHKWLFSN